MTQGAIDHINNSLVQLTDFQSATVDEAFLRLIGPHGPRGRLLVGDEVGLGKTLVARGVIAKFLLNFLAHGKLKRPFRVVYICSNLALAQENANKLAVFRGEGSDQWVSSPRFGRLAELGLLQAPPKGGLLLELCSLTPATSFSLTKGGGNARERYIIWRAVAESPYVRETDELEQFFRNDVSHSWLAAQDFYNAAGGLEQVARQEFSVRLGTPPRLDDKALAAAEEHGLSLHSWRSLLRGVSELPKNKEKNQPHLERQVRGRIREMFVEACAQNLKADLFILDEFQRFRDLVNVSSDSGSSEDKVSEEQVIARRVLHEGENYATLLLSATPFKALTHLGEEGEGKAHAQELSELLKYLCKSDQKIVGRYESKREALLADILSLPEGPLPANSLKSEAKAAVESVLRTFICRTERAGVEPDIDRIFSDVPAKHSVPSPTEIKEFIALDRLSEALKEASVVNAGVDVMKLHKAAPWCLSFLGGYQLRDSLRDHSRVSGVSAAIKGANDAWISAEKFGEYRVNLSRDAPSARFKQVLDAAAPNGAERLLWVPPAMPNYGGDGPFAGKENFSKTLLFSSLVLAPRALSSYVSYECERRLIPRGPKPSYFKSRDVLARTFRFDAKSLSTAWGLVYPSARLSSIEIAGEDAGLNALRARIEKELAPDYKQLCSIFGKGKSTKKTSWYVYAPILLDWLSDDGKDHIRQWASSMKRVSGSSEMRKSQVERLLQVLEEQKFKLGKPPSDLKSYLVDLAIAGAGVCMNRSIRTAWKGATHTETVESENLLAGATDAALSFLDKMNRIESQRVIRAVCGSGKPWIAVANYSAMGNLQAVFDEYVHLLKSIHRTLPDSMDAFKVAVDTGAVSVTAQSALPVGKGDTQFDVRFHCHYAVPLGNQKSTDEAGVSRM